MAIHFDKYDAELVALRQLVQRVREHHPDWSLKQCAHEAVRQFNDSEVRQFESDAQYIALLVQGVLDGGGSDPGRQRNKG